MPVTENLILKAIQAAYLAGKAIMEVYDGHFDIEFKTDNSPITIADKKAHLLISEILAATGLPVLSEEGVSIPYQERKNWEQFWMVDPLDGTKEFINRNGDFTVNIALIDKQIPIFGVIFAPVPGLIFWGSEAGSFRFNVKKTGIFDFQHLGSLEKSAEKLPCVSVSVGCRVVGSRSHFNPETESYINELRKTYPELSFISRGSSLKFCTIAEGSADFYPRFGPTMEWDTAAGHGIARFAGCSVVQAENGLPLIYNKPSLLNPNFIATAQKIRQPEGCPIPEKLE